MNIVGYIVIGIVILIVLLVYLLFMLAYITSAISYRKAERAKATVMEDLGDIKLATGTVGGATPKFRAFHKYKVSFYLDGEQRIEEVELKNCHLKVGETTEIRYTISKKGKLLLESESFLCWTREMAIGYTLGLIMGIVLVILEMKGMID